MRTCSSGVGWRRGGEGSGDEAHEERVLPRGRAAHLFETPRGSLATSPRHSKTTASTASSPEASSEQNARPSAHARRATQPSSPKPPRRASGPNARGFHPSGFFPSAAAVHCCVHQLPRWRLFSLVGCYFISNDVTRVLYNCILHRLGGAPGAAPRARPALARQTRTRRVRRRLAGPLVAALHRLRAENAA